jgi:hypothetical protein
MSRARLLPTLFTELYQAERSAYRHPIREARRLGDVPPAAALRAVAAHANETLDALPPLAKTRGLAFTSLGAALAEALSTARHAVTDRLAEIERSYRGTLLGMHHGIDLMRLVRAAAHDEGDDALVAFCDEWLPTREWLVREVADELEWFARHPDVARRHGHAARSSPLFDLASRVRVPRPV